MFSSFPGEAISKVGGSHDPSMDSYNKLIAWLNEMAQSDNEQFETRTIFEQIKKINKHNRKSNHLQKQQVTNSNYSDLSDTYLSSDSPGTPSSLPEKSLQYELIYGTTRYGSIGRQKSMGSFGFDTESDTDSDSVDPNTTLLKKPLISVMDIRPPMQTIVRKSREHSSVRTSLVNVRCKKQENSSSDKNINDVHCNKTQETSFTDIQAKKDRIVLNDALLDSNIEEILFSMDALWPKS